MKICGLSIAIAQINPTVGHLDKNVSLIEDALSQVSAADIVVFPELAISGYPPEDLVLKPSFVQSCMQRARDLIERTKALPCAYVLTTPWEEDGNVFNAALFVYAGHILGKTYKHHRPNYGVFDEVRVFAQGPLPDVVTFKGVKIGLQICEDLWFSDGCSHLKAHGAQMILSPNGSPYSLEKYNNRKSILLARIHKTGLPIVYVNQVGGQDDLVFDGRSMVLDAYGECLFNAPLCQTYVGITQPNKIHSVPAREEEIYTILKTGLRDYITKNNFSGVLIGMSGGIDSALSAAIAVDALGADKVRCVMMPSSYTSRESFDDAKACCNALGCSYEEISIAPAMAAYQDMIPSLNGLAHENMQSRARGLILMSLSNQSGAMVLTTGNKSEMAVGYATLYGDMCGGYNVLKDIYKTVVYNLARWRNTQSCVIPERIITKAPTAELRDNQTDQDSLPPYDILDAILEGLIERDLGVSDLIVQGFAAETVQKVHKLLDLAEYKRRQAAPGVKITERAFGRDRRYPITNDHRFTVEKP